MNYNNNLYFKVRGVFPANNGFIRVNDWQGLKYLLSPRDKASNDANGDDLEMDKWYSVHYNYGAKKEGFEVQQKFLTKYVEVTGELKDKLEERLRQENPEIERLYKE